MLLSAAERFREFARSLLLCFKQSRVLDGDYRLIGEGRGKFDLFVVEWPYSVAP